MSKEIERELLEEELDLGAETEDLVPDSVDMTEPLKIYLLIYFHAFLFT